MKKNHYEILVVIKIRKKKLQLLNYKNINVFTKS